MRLEINLLSDRTFSLPRDYRRYFISFLKSVFEPSPIYQDLFQEKKFKPYTFSVYLSDKFKIEGREIQAGENLFLIFSSGALEVLGKFYNGAVDIKKREGEIILDTVKLKIGKITILSQKKITSKKVLFKTIGVSVLTDPKISAKNFKEWYLLPTDNLEKFNKALEERTREKYKYLKGEDREFNLELKNLTDEEFQILKVGGFVDSEFESPIKETSVEHYNGYVRGFRGVFWLLGEPEILQFIYDFGFGVRTGQGFGLLDIITQC